MLSGDLQRKVDDVGFWFHSIDLGQGVVTKGVKSAQKLDYELRKCNLPDLHGKSVLDVGCIDGFFSFAAEKLGTARVLGMDY